jgi:hypothetical protein
MQPEISVMKPVMQPEISVMKPVMQPEISVMQPEMKPEMQPGRPQMKPRRPQMKPGMQPGMQPERSTTVGNMRPDISVDCPVPWMLSSDKKACVLEEYVYVDNVLRKRFPSSQPLPEGSWIVNDTNTGLWQKSSVPTNPIK